MQHLDDSTAEIYVPDQGEEKWRFGLCQCTENPSWCCIGTCMPVVLFMRIGDHIQKVTEVKAILILIFFMMLLYGIHYGMQVLLLLINLVSVTSIFMLMVELFVLFILAMLVLLVLYCIKVAKLRGDIRQRYGIEGSEGKDCCAVFCCSCCSNCQMFQEVADREGMILA